MDPGGGIAGAWPHPPANDVAVAVPAGRASPTFQPTSPPCWACCAAGPWPTGGSRRCTQPAAATCLASTCCLPAEGVLFDGLPAEAGKRAPTPHAPRRFAAWLFAPCPLPVVAAPLQPQPDVPPPQRRGCGWVQPRREACRRFDSAQCNLVLAICSCDAPSLAFPRTPHRQVLSLSVCCTPLRLRRRWRRCTAPTSACRRALLCLRSWPGISSRPCHLPTCTGACHARRPCLFRPLNPLPSRCCLKRSRRPATRRLQHQCGLRRTEPPCRWT